MIFRTDIFGELLNQWFEKARIPDPDKKSADQFGWSVNVSGDGTTAIVGAYYADPNNITDAGAAYVFVNTPSGWVHQATLTASDKSASDIFGVDVALSYDGNTAIVGAHGADVSGVSNAGAAYVFTRSGSTWSQQAKLTAGDLVANSRFGYSVALSDDGNTAAIGAYFASTTGAAYVFTRSGSTWSQQAKVVGSNLSSDANFGVSVSLSGDSNTLAVGSRSDTVSGAVNAGSAHVFTRSGSTWSEQAKLTALDASAWDFFGRIVSLSNNGNTLVVSAHESDPGGAGSFYVFERVGDIWSQQAKVASPNPQSSAYFGRSCISGDGNTIVTGAYREDVNGNTDSGSAYVFTRNGSSWTLHTTLVPSNPQAYALFGWALWISDDGRTVIVGARDETVDGAGQAGAVYIYQLQ